jgi:hypothetical protein
MTILLVVKRRKASKCSFWADAEEDVGLKLGGWLDAEAEVYILLVAGVGVEVVGGAAVELVTLAEFAAYEEAEGYSAEGCGDPADGLHDRRIFVFLVGSGVVCEVGSVLGVVTE